MSHPQPDTKSACVSSHVSCLGGLWQASKTTSVFIRHETSQYCASLPLAKQDAGWERQLPSPLHKQQGNSLNKCNLKLFSLRIARKSVSNVHPVYVCSAWHLEFKLPQVLVQPANKTWKPNILNLVCIMLILFLEVHVTAIQWMFVFLIELRAFKVLFRSEFPCAKMSNFPLNHKLNQLTKSRTPINKRAPFLCELMSCSVWFPI